MIKKVKNTVREMAPVVGMVIGCAAGGFAGLLLKKNTTTGAAVGAGIGLIAGSLVAELI